MRRAIALVAAGAAIGICAGCPPAQGAEVGASARAEHVAGRWVTRLVHGDRPAPDADRRSGVRAARWRSLRRADAGLGHTTLAGAWCGTPRGSDDTAHAAASPGRFFKVVYARPADLPGRFAGYADLIQSDVRAASEAVAAAAGGERTLRVDVGTSCGPDYADIAAVALPRARAAYLVDGLTAAPLPLRERHARIKADVVAALGPVAGVHDLLIYADGLGVDGGVTGVSELFADDSPGPGNLHEAGGLAAVVFGTSTASTTAPGFGTAGSRVSSLLHELLHTLGAVQSTAPHATGASHCTDGRDLLCYADGGPRGRPQDLTEGCPDSDPAPIDCGADDYFAPAPPAGSYLAAHRNAYASGFLCPVGACVAGAGNRAPQATFVVRDLLGQATITPAAGAVVTLDATGTGDADGTITDFAWDLGADGGIDAVGGVVAATLPDRPGPLAVRLLVHDDAGAPGAAVRTLELQRVDAAAGVAGAVTGAVAGGTAPAGTTAAAASVLARPAAPAGAPARRRAPSAAAIDASVRRAVTAAIRRLRALGLLGLRRGGTVLVRLRAVADGRLVARIRRGRTTVGSRSVRARRGRTVSVRVPLSAAGRRSLTGVRDTALQLQLVFTPADR